jgi:hypothetical protein
MGDPRKWLVEHGADDIEHAGGSLYAHLNRVYDRLGALGLDEPLRMAGLTHAVYGTDGFPVSLLDVADRAVLRELVGAEAEEQVYRYGGCDRGHSWRALATTREIHSRFTGHVEAPEPAQLRDFVDLSIVNELDVAEHDREVARKYGDYFRSVFGDWAGLATPAVIADARRVLNF